MLGSVDYRIHLRTCFVSQGNVVIRVVVLNRLPEVPMKPGI